MSRSDVIEEVTDEADAAILEESRRVLVHQIDRIESVDDKAAWTLRIGVVLLGVVVSIVQSVAVGEPFSAIGANPPMWATKIETDRRTPASTWGRNESPSSHTSYCESGRRTESDEERT